MFRYLILIFVIATVACSRPEEASRTDIPPPLPPAASIDEAVERRTATDKPLEEEVCRAWESQTTADDARLGPWCSSKQNESVKFSFGYAAASALDVATALTTTCSISRRDDPGTSKVTQLRHEISRVEVYRVTDGLLGCPPERSWLPVAIIQRIQAQAEVVAIREQFDASKDQAKGAFVLNPPCCFADSSTTVKAQRAKVLKYLSRTYAAHKRVAAGWQIYTPSEIDMSLFESATKATFPNVLPGELKSLGAYTVRSVYESSTGAYVIIASRKFPGFRTEHIRLSPLGVCFPYMLETLSPTPGCPQTTDGRQDDLEPVITPDDREAVCLASGMHAYVLGAKIRKLAKSNFHRIEAGSIARQHYAHDETLHFVTPVDATAPKYALPNCTYKPRVNKGKGGKK